jgi:O-antigen/teichoic acid export membrane protein
MKLFRNFFNLMIWQGSNYLVPLVVTPYLARVLGLHAFGVFGFTVAVAAYGILLSDWGFNLSATQKISRAVNDPAQLRQLFWATFLAKVTLSLIALVVLGIVTVSVPFLRAIWPEMMACSLSIIATAISVYWFLLGTQSMGGFAASALIGRLVTIPLMLLFVHRPGDVWIAVAIQGGTQFISAAVSIVISSRVARLTPFEFRPRLAWRQVYDGWHQFLSNFSVSLYTQLNGIFVGIFAGPAQLGLLTGSQRISSAFQGLVMPINMAVYPQVNYLVEHNPPAALRLMTRVFFGQAAYAACLSAAMYVAAPFIVPRFLGAAFEPATAVLQVLAIMPCLAGLTNVLGQNILLPLGLKSAYTGALVAAGLVNIVLLVLLVRPFGAIGGAMAGVITEIGLVLMMGGAVFAKRRMLIAMRGRAVEPVELPQSG